MGSRDLWEVALEFWANRLDTILGLLTQTPQNFEGGAIWPIIVNIYTALQGIGYGLLIIFWAFSVFKNVGSFAEMKRPSMVIGLFLRFVLAKAAIDHGLEIVNLIADIAGGVVQEIVNVAAVNPTALNTIAPELEQAFATSGVLAQVPIFIVTLTVSGLVIFAAIQVLLTVYLRYFKLYTYVCLAPIGLSGFAGQTTQFMGMAWIKSFAGVCLEVAAIAIGCIIYSAFAGSAMSILGTDTPLKTVMGYLIPMAMYSLILLTTVKASDQLMNKMLGL